MTDASRTTGTSRRAPRSALIELTLARLRLFVREPSAMFWTFGFPVVLAVALGAAFRNRPPEPVRIAVEDGPGAAQTVARLASDQIKVTLEDAAAARADLRTGKVSLVVTLTPVWRWISRYGRPRSRSSTTAQRSAIACNSAGVQRSRKKLRHSSTLRRAKIAEHRARSCCCSWRCVTGRLVFMLMRRSMDQCINALVH